MLLQHETSTTPGSFSGHGAGWAAGSWPGAGRWFPGAPTLEEFSRRCGGVKSFGAGPSSHPGGSSALIGIRTRFTGSPPTPPPPPSSPAPGPPLLPRYAPSSSSSFSSSSCSLSGRSSCEFGSCLSSDSSLHRFSLCISSRSSPWFATSVKTSIHAVQCSSWRRYRFHQRLQR